MPPCGSRQAWDVIVAGAGPAGSALALRLCARHRVLLLDRQRPPRTVSAAPPLGESLPGAATTLLRSLRHWPQFLADGHRQRTATLSCWDHATPVWFDALRDPCGPGWHLHRDRFEASLRRAALESGAELLRVHGPLQPKPIPAGWQLLAPRLGLCLEAPVLIDATGRRSVLAHQLPIRRQHEPPLLCLHTHLPGAGAPGDGTTRICADHDGWWYSVLLPSGPRLLALFLDPRAEQARRLRTSPALLDMARRHPLLAEVLPKQVQGPVGACHAAGSVLDGPLPTGFFAIGDASISFDPIASQGLFHALATAESAAVAIEDHLAGRSEAQAALGTELRAVAHRYRHHRQATYAGPARRFPDSPFWHSRSGSRKIDNLWFNKISA
ncbi:MAG: NAD(P)/FAD-dependent oxidoreductase [Cyanobacteriota bacterium]